MDKKEIIQKILDLACDIQQVPSPTFHETERARYVMDLFLSRHLVDIRTDSAGNVWSFLPGGNAKPLVINAHLDTVHQLRTPLPLEKSGNRITGPGIGDNSLGLASMIGLVDYLDMQKESLPGGIWFVANVGEEGLGNLRGMVEVVKQLGDRPVAYIVLEGMGLGQIFHRGLGVKRYRINVQTNGGHSWEDYGSPSAIHEAANIINRITSLHLPKDPRTTVNIGTIHGGTTVNTIAPSSTMEIDLRSEEQATLEDFSRKIISIADSTANNQIKVKIDSIGDRPSGFISENHPLVKLAKDILISLDIQPSLNIASTDANVPLSKGLPAICIGITKGGMMHTLDEYIDTTLVEKGFQQLYSIVTKVWERL